MKSSKWFGTLDSTEHKGTVQNSWGTLPGFLENIASKKVLSPLFYYEKRYWLVIFSQNKVLVPLLQDPARVPHEFFPKTEASRIQVFDNTVENCINLSNVTSERIDVNQTICINGYFNGFLNTKYET